MPSSATKTLAPTRGTVEDLQRALFSDDYVRIHEPWRKLISTEEFRYQAALTPDARLALSYARLGVLNGAVESVPDLVSDPYRLASMHEWLGTADGGMTTVAGIHYNLCLGTLFDHELLDRDGARRPDVAELIALRRTGTYLVTEHGHGNDAPSLETTATFDPTHDEFVLHTPTSAAQKFMPNTSPVGGPKTGLVAARLISGGHDHGVFLFLTPLTGPTGPLPGVRIRELPERIGNPVDHCLTAFDHVRVPRTALLESSHGRLSADGVFVTDIDKVHRRFLQAIGRVTTGKLCITAGAVGATRTALAIAVRYAGHRHISGFSADERVPILAHRSHHGRLLKAMATSYAMTFLHRAVLRSWAEQRDTDRRDIERLIAITKGWITWQTRTILVECRERCGAAAMFPVNGIADLAVNVEGAITAEGDNLPIWCKAASEMLLGHPVPTPETSTRPGSRDDLTDPWRCRDLLAAAERIWRGRARTRLMEGPADDLLGRWNAAVDPAVAMVAAHARLQAADAFLAAADRAQDPTAHNLLRKLYLLFALQQITEQSGDLLADGHLTAHQVRQIPDAIDDLIGELAPNMMTLVEAFNLPEEVIGQIPIANDANAGLPAQEAG
jgi:acyl-CoA oxidase